MGLKQNNLFSICSRINDCIYDLKYISDYLGIFDDDFDDIIKQLRFLHNQLCFLHKSVLRACCGGND